MELDRILNGIQDNESSIEDLAQILELSEQPKRIEGYDISHIQGSDPITSRFIRTLLNSIIGNIKLKIQTFL